MMTLRCVSVCTVVFAIRAVAGCSAAPVPEDGNSASSEVGIASEDLVFKDAFSPTGALLVVRDHTTGELNVSMRGQIGVDDDGLAKSVMSKSTFVESYRVLHPNAKDIPPTVRQVSDALSAQHARLVQTISPAELSSRPAAPILDKSASDFNSKACQLIGGGFEGWSPKYCSYQYGWHSICTFSTIGTQDKSIAWNESPYSGVHTLSGMTSQVIVPAWNWYWTQWGGTYQNRIACLELTGNNTYGNLGITHHKFFTDQAFNPLP